MIERRTLSRPSAILLLALAALAASCGDSSVDGHPTSTVPATGPAATLAAVDAATLVYLFDAELYSPAGTVIVPTVEMDRLVPQGEGPWPTVVILHGGDSESAAMEALALAIVEHGAVAYVPDYLESGWPTLEQVESGNSRPDQALGDIACAVRVARADASAHGGDPDRLVLLGFSRGGQIGAVVALAGDDPAVTGSASGTCAEPSGSAVPQAFVGLDGPYDWESFAAATQPELWAATDLDLMAKISPLTYADIPAAAPAFYLVSGGQATDDGSFAEHANRFADSLVASGHQVETLELPHVFHTGFQYPGVVPEVVDLVGEVAADTASS